MNTPDAGDTERGSAGEAARPETSAERHARIRDKVRARVKLVPCYCGDAVADMREMRIEDSAIADRNAARRSMPRDA